MNISVAQHPVLWLFLAFLLGLFVEWMLEVFFFRRPLADARASARRRGEELDSERFAHGRTQSELKAKLGELEIAQKARTLAESLLSAARSKLTIAEDQEAEFATVQKTLESELASVQNEARSAASERDSLAGEQLGLRLLLAEQQAAWATESGAAEQLRSRLVALQAAFDAATARLPDLETEAFAQATKCEALDSDLQAAMRRHADAESALGEVRGALIGAQEEIAAARKVRSRLEEDESTLTAKLKKLESSASDAKAGSSATEQKLKARIEEVKQLTAQMGEASEELAAVKAKAAQLEANLAAAQATRKSLEKELEQRLAAAPPVGDLGELAALREQVRQQERSSSNWQGKAVELEAELLATSRAHQALEKQLERLRAGKPDEASNDSLAAELEIMTRKRNQLAAELAALKAVRPR